MDALFNNPHFTNAVENFQPEMILAVFLFILLCQIFMLLYLFLSNPLMFLVKIAYLIYKILFKVLPSFVVITVLDLLIYFLYLVEMAFQFLEYLAQCPAKLLLSC